jgi:16S rRNA (cytosine1402-N4)-methyltransferase
MDEVLRVLAPAPGQVVADCTLGLGGHAAAILQRLRPGGLLVGMDLDSASIAGARIVLQRVVGREQGARFATFHASFAALPRALAHLGLSHVDALLADLGVASTQIDDPARGFSYRHDGPLDMRMDPSRAEPASALLARMSEQEIADALLDLGDETDAPAIARLIVQARARAPIDTTSQLVQIVCDARGFTLLRASRAKLHPAARTFQALRILVNRELGALQTLLDALPAVLRPGAPGQPGGVCALISFHSGEDRLVKHALRAGLRAGVFSQISPDPIVATDAEKRANPRARSAKLRWARRA